MDLLNIKQIVNESDNLLGHQQTYKDAKHKQIEDKRVSAAVSKRPSQLRATVSRASGRGGPGSRKSSRGIDMADGLLPDVVDLRRFTTLDQP